jgi:hypothetical protein
MTPTEVTLRGRTAKAHIDKWQQYGEKAKQHATSAACILVEVKAALNHGKYTPWLKQHGIASSTARRLVLEHHSPEKREERQAKDREYQTTKRSESERYEPTTPKGDENVDTAIEAKRARLVAYVRHADASEIARLYNAIRP